jgi:hypothetical protein
MIKKELGQFYTTKASYIFDEIDIKHINNPIIEPFVGNGDILDWLFICNMECNEYYDIDPKIKNTIKRDTLLNPPSYKNKFVITNPPYLARNKSKNKTLYDIYGLDDLYKIFIKTFVDGDACGGIIIIPQNFLTSEDSNIRKLFFENYHIIRINIFEERVFEDTDYSICSIYFMKEQKNNNIEVCFYPNKEKMIITLNENNRWRFGGDIELFKKKKGKYKISRLVVGGTPNTNLFLHCVDTGSSDGKISLSIEKDPYYGILTDRVFATILSNYEILDESYVVEEFNLRLNKLRNEYHSMFLTNFRNSSKEYSRKRIGFGMAFTMIENILNEKWG